MFDLGWVRNEIYVRFILKKIMIANKFTSKATTTTAIQPNKIFDIILVLFFVLTKYTCF